MIPHGDSFFTIRRALLITTGATSAIVAISAVLMLAVDNETFDSYWSATWWALQTVTTVGYGDIVPESKSGQAVGAFVMLAGIGMASVITAAVASAFIESARRRRGRDPLYDQLDRLEKRLDEIASRLDERQ